MLQKKIRQLGALCLLCLAFSPAILAQESIGLEWIKAITRGGTGNNSATPWAVTRDVQGNLLITGSFIGIVDFDPGPATYYLDAGPRTEIFVLKLNASGSLVWATKMTGGSNPSFGFGIASDGSGNVYVTGHFSGTVDFDPGIGVYNLTTQEAGISNIFVQKLDAQGNFVWAKSMGGDLSCEGNAIQVDAAGNVYSTGYFRSTVDFDPGAGTHLLESNGTGASASNAYIQKLDSQGNFVWVKSMWTSEGNGISLDGEGNIYTTGLFGGTVDFDPGTGTYNLVQNGADRNSFIQKLDADGNFMWARSTGGGSNTGAAIQVDAAGNVYSTGVFTGTVDFDPGAGIYNLTSLPADANSMFVQKLDTNGDFVWVRAVLGLAQGDDIDVDAAGNVYCVGEFYGTADFDPGAGTYELVAEGRNVFALSLNAAGDFVWAKKIRGTPGYAGGVSVNEEGSVFVVGRSDAGVSGEGACNYSVAPGAFIAKLSDAELPEGFAVSPSIIGPLNQTSCVLGIPGIITGNSVQVTAPSGDTRALTFQWQVATATAGPWEDIPGEIFADLQPLSGNITRYYRRQVKAVTAYCELQVVATSEIATIAISSDIAPIANADGPQWFVCGENNNTVTLNGSADGVAPFSYAWFQGSSSYGTLVGSSSAFTTPAITAATTYTLQVTDAQGCIDIEQVTIVPVVANAGADQSLCQGELGVQIGTPPIADPSVVYTWEVLSGTAGSLSCTSCAQPVAQPSVDTQYQLTTTVPVKGGATCSSVSTVWVRPVSAPNNLLEFAGSDKVICYGETVTLGGASAGTGYSYTWSSGQYLSSASAFNPTFNAGTAHASCPMVYTVSASKDGCTFTDEVKVSVIESDIDFQDETKCGPLWVGSREIGNYNCTDATYSWSLVSGTGSIIATRNNDREAFLISTSGASVFRRTVTVDGFSCSADIQIEPCTVGTCDFELITLSSQGCPKVFGDFAELRVGTKFLNPDDYTFQWSPANMVDNDEAPTVTITNTSPFTLTLTVTNKHDPSIQCSESIDINTPGWTLPDFTMSGGTGCVGTPIQIGGAGAGGFSYQWSAVTGLSDPSAPNPFATVSESTSYTVVVTEDATGCASTYTVPVTVSTIWVDAGPDRAVCNGGTATLGVPAPSGTGWTYQWEPSETAWANGTNSTQPQPQVLFAFASPQTYVVTVTDPLTGCTATDQVVVRNDQEADEYSGADQETCTGVPVELGTEPIPGATYAWFNADGVTPATGLSCTTCARPVFVNPQATTTYVVNVSFGETCTTPLSADVTITVNTVAGLDLDDRDMCTNLGIAIGYGNGINPPAPAGATFQWFPATGLDNPNSANPIATVNQETVYTVIVTLSSGCEFRDEVRVRPFADPGPDHSICLGESVQLGGAPVTGVSYVWTGDGIQGDNTVANPTVSPLTTTTYTLTATNAGGCESVREVVVTVNTPADFDITGTTSICEGGVATVGIAGAVPPNTLWQWSPATGVQNPTSPNTVIAATSTQTYRLTQTNTATGCSNFKEVIIVVNPGFNVTTTDLILCPGDAPKSMVLNVTSGSGNYQYSWSPSVGLSNPFIASPVVTTTVDRTYTATVTDLTTGCQSVRTVEVDVKTTEECDALPVTLVSFKVREEGETVQLGWTTSSEVNSSYFDIEKSRNAREWSEIGRVSAKGAGVSQQSYSFTDSEPHEGMNFYRLKMVDSDGSFEYSAIQSLSFERSVETTVFPNPVAGILHIKASDWENVSRVDILNTSGQTVYQSQEVPFQQVNVANLPGGIYMVKILRKNGMQTIRKIVVDR